MIDVNSMTREERRELENESVVLVRMEGKFNVSCTVFDTRNRYGQVDLRVQPVSGDGTYWVSSDRCTVSAYPTARLIFMACPSCSFEIEHTEDCELKP